MTRAVAVHLGLFAAVCALLALTAAIAPATAHRGGPSPDCACGCHEPLCDGRNCDCSCHG